MLDIQPMPRPDDVSFLTYVRSALFYGLCGLIIVPFLVLWPAIWLPARIPLAITDCYLRVQLGLLRWVCGIRYELSGQSHMPKGAVLIASQHESTWETLFFQCLLGRPVMYAKKPIFSYPIFGPLVRKMGHIPVELSTTGDAMRAGLRAGVDVLQDGRKLLIFPTGTRGAHGAGALQAGVGVLYQLSQAPVVPVRLNSGACWPANSFLKIPGTIKIDILPPIATGLDRPTFMAELAQSLQVSQPS